MCFFVSEEQCNPFKNEDESPASKIKTKHIVLGVAAFILTGAICLIASYFLNAQFSTLINQAITHIQQGQLSIGQSLLYVGLPIAGAGFLIGLAIHVHRKRQQMKIQDRGERELLQNFKQIMSAKHLIISSIAICALVALCVGGYFLFKEVPAAYQWLHQSVIPAFQQKMQVWQSLAYVGSTTAALSLITGVALYLLIRRAEQKEGDEYLNNLYSLSD